MRKLTLFIIILSFASSAFTINLEEALISGYNNNDDLKSIRTKFLNEIEEFPQAFSGFMPRASLEAGRANTKNKYNSQLINRASRDVDSQQGALKIEQPVFNGGSSVAALKSAQSAFRAARGDYYAQEQKILLSLINDYLNYYETKEKYEISESRLRTNIQQVRTVEEKLRLGEATEIDMATARAGLAAAETDKLIAYANFQSKKAAFTKSFGMEPSGIKMPPLPENLPTSSDELIQKAIKLNPKIDSVRHSVHANKAQEMVLKGKLLPQVGFSVQTGKAYYNPEDLGNNNINNRSTTSTLSVTIPIYSKGGAEYSDIRKAKNQTRSTAIQLDNTIKQVEADAISSWEEFAAAKSRIISTNHGVEAAQISYDGTVQEEIVGSKTVLDVLSAEDKLYEAKTSRVDAYKASILAAYQIKSLTGELTAKSLKLKVKYFSPEDEFKNIKKKLIIGF
ncbi:TolC family protein [Rickettsia endosymbiont of Halotydeus destructor]|uniref:TolC family protein n=1 Tax=Rickettsia endosymbiont of Halotydeus destructor TaxID=2996754 RepID=UPI003BAE7F87